MESRLGELKRAAVTLPAAIVLFAAAGVAALQQVRVTDPTTEATRACGSGFDVAVDRSGWEQWWLADLDEPDGDVRATLLRTTTCPTAVNRRTTIAGILAALGVVSAVVYVMSRPFRLGDVDRRSVLDRRLLMLGRSATFVGGSLIAGGLMATVVLVGDADASMFRYVDRPVVFVGGLLLLAPAVTLVAVGLALSFVGRHREPEALDDP